MSTGRIEILSPGEPEPPTGSVRFECRCGFVIDSANYLPRTGYGQPDTYADARKAHKDACPMRFDPPWPFDRLPRLRSQLLGGAATGPDTPDADPSALEPRTSRPATGVESDATPPVATQDARADRAHIANPRQPRAASPHWGGWSARALLRDLLSGAPAWVRRRAAVRT